MQLSRLVIAALSLSALTAYAESPAASGQFAQTVTAATAGAPAQSPANARVSGGNPWSTSFNPLAGFQSQRTRADVTAEYVRSRGAVAAFTGEDSGSAVLSATRGGRFAGQPVSAD